LRVIQRGPAGRPAASLTAKSLAVLFVSFDFFGGKIGVVPVEDLFQGLAGLAGLLLEPAQQFVFLPSMYRRSLSVSWAYFCFSLPLVTFQFPLMVSVFMGGWV
jgi:hypothetical protein